MLAKYCIVAVAVALMLLGLTGEVRENDQAQILHESIALAKSGHFWSTAFYNYDKQFLTFWLMAIALKITQPFGAKIDIVLLSNLLTLGLLVASILLFSFTRGLRDVRAWQLACILFAPTFVLYAPFFSSAAISAAFLIALIAACTTRAKSKWLLLAGLSFAATSARADAILVLPFIAWSFVEAKRVRDFVTHRQTIAMATGAAIALIAGRLMYHGPVQNAVPLFFAPKIFATYVLFGLGAAGLLWLFCVVALLQQLRRSRRGELTYVLLGLALFLLPCAYYTGMLLSPRYLFVAVISLLAFAASPHCRSYTEPFLQPAVVTTTFALTVMLPWILGLHLPFPTKPRPVVSGATLFPTADGLYPMGGYLDFILRFRRNHRVDHNQAILAAARQTAFAPDQTGKVPIADTPMAAYLRLAVDLQNKESYTAPLQAVGQQSCYYDCRTLFRPTISLNEASPHDLLSYETIDHTKVASGKIDTNAICMSSSEPSAELATLEMVRQAFAGNEFRVMQSLSDELSIPRDWEGKQIVFFSSKPFAVEAPLLNLHRTSALTTSGKYNLVSFSGRDWYGANKFKIDNTNTAKVTAAIAILPDYMRIVGKQ